MLSLRERLGAWIAGYHGETKASATGPIVARRVAGRAVAPLERYADMAKEAYQRNVIAYHCIREIAEGVASVPRLLFQGDAEAKPDNEAWKVLRRPNPMQAWDSWCGEVISYFLLSGNTYMEKVGPTTGPPKELWSLRPDRMSVVAGETGMPQSYVYKIGTDKTTFDVDPLTGRCDLRHMKTFHPLDDWYGMSPIQAVSTGINQFNESGAWNQSLLEKGASRGGGLELQAQDGRHEILGDIEYEKLMKRLEEQYSGAKNAGRPKVFEGGLKYVDTNFSPQDMDWMNGKYGSAREICAALNYPPQLLGIPGDNTYNTYREARQALFENAVMPLMWRFFSELDVWLLPDFGENLTLKPDEDQVLALAPRRESLWDRVAKADWITHQEKRAATSYEPWEATGDPADDLYQSATLLPLSFAVPEDAEPGSPASPKPNGSGGSKFDESEAITSASVLNGAQVTAIVELVQSVALGVIEKSSAIELMGVAFGIDAETAGKIIGTPKPAPQAMQ